MGSFNISDGWNWKLPVRRRRAEQIIEWSPPDILVLTPPCGPLSRFQNMQPLDRRVDLEQHLKEVIEAKEMVKWCLCMANKQLALGKHYVFEASVRSGGWSMLRCLTFRLDGNIPW